MAIPKLVYINSTLVGKIPTLVAKLAAPVTQDLGFQRFSHQSIGQVAQKSSKNQKFLMKYPLVN
jgi:hypothetical protein